MGVTTNSVAGIVAGKNPLEYSASSPYVLFIFQSIFILILCWCLNWPLRKLQQPKVIAEVVAGIIMGPSVMGHIPNFTSTVFPKESIPGLTLVANVGIILFLFMIGLEVDLSFIKKHFRAALSVGLINMAVPFALGCGIARGFYNEYADPESHISFTTYMVFIAVAMCITAFPVLARILTELNLIGDRVGTIVLAAGITNDLTGWILLALAVTLANASKPVNVVYILLLAVGWFLFMCYPVRIAMRWLITRFTNDMVTGEPCQSSMLFILITCFISAFYTDSIGIHPIFGAFMCGVIVPRTRGYAVRVTERIEELVQVLFIPVYFCLAGLNCDLGLLNRGIDWGYTIGIIGLAMIGKICGGYLAARLNKLYQRESLAVGILMSCKGIVEIVVLNIGLQAGIISQKVYSIFIVMALITTFLTTPLSLYFYPVSYREKRDKFLKGEINWDGTPRTQSDDTTSTSLLGPKTLGEVPIKDLDGYSISRTVLLLKNIDTISYLMQFVQMFNTSGSRNDIKAVHLREFTSRTSHLLEASTNLDDGQIVSDDNRAEFGQSSAILMIVKAFSEVSGFSCTLKSVLSTFQNHVLTINSEIIGGDEMLLMSVRLNAFSQDSNEFILSTRLFNQAKCHFGLLLINERISGGYRRFSTEEIKMKSKSNLLEVHEIPEDQSTVLMGDEYEDVPLIDPKSINLMMYNDNAISSSDKLALHMIHRLICPSTAQINVFVKTSAISSSMTSAREEEIASLFASKKSDIQVNFFTFKDNLNREIHKYQPRIGGELFVVANNESAPVESLTGQSTFSPDVNSLMNASVEHSFHVLVVKAK
ncbi:K(+)/H(+) antiporter 1 [Diutina catenulata]